MIKDNKHERLSDLILEALQLALKQEDLPVSEALNKALELSMTRNTGGGEFIERRIYTKEVEAAMDRLRSLKS
jgi:hypothetical protein